MSDMATTASSGGELPWRLIGLGLAGAAAPLALVGLGACAPLPALLAAAILSVATLIVARRPAPVTMPAPQASRPLSAGGAFSAVIELRPDPILLIEGDTRAAAGARRFVLANAAARSLLRLQRGEGLLTTAIRSPVVLDAVDEALFERRPAEGAYEIRGAQDRFWRARALPIAVADAESGPALAVLWLRDETEQRRIERTRADFLANASHELRTPLASLSGFIETLRGHARDDEAAREKFLAIMQAQAERMRRLIDDLMSLSRIELAEHIAPSGEVDLGLVVTEVLDGLAPMAAEHRVRFEPDLPPVGAALAVADRDQIIQVIQNLAENAVKYSACDGVVRIQVQPAASVTLAARPASGALARFSLLTPEPAMGQSFVAVRVWDRGAGIARIHLPRLTERFYRVEGQKPGDRTGTGLGLAIVKHIVNRHRGGLVVESAPGEGAVFTAYFPAAETPAACEPATMGLTA
jgi:two-component system phosphate regulon sensor histidine kinase PhoR